MATPTPETAIWLALKSRVSSLSLSSSLTVAYPNEEFTPPESGDYLAVALLRNATDAATMGGSGKNRYRGILQITLRYSKNSDFAVPTEIAGDIAAHFKLGTTMTNNGVTVRVETPPSVGNDLSETDAKHAEIPVSIRWQADANR